MVRIQKPHRWIIPALCAAGLATAGCNSQDDSPTGASNVDVELDSATVSENAISTMDFMNGLIDGVDALAAGDLSGVAGDLGLPQGSTVRDDFVASYDDLQGAWVFDANGTETDASGTATYDVYFLVRFIDAAGAPQQEPDQTTSRMDLDLDFHVSASAEEDGSTFALALDYTMDLSVSGIQTGPYVVDGTGDIGVDMELTGSGAEEDLRLDLAMGWDMDVSVPVSDGCPSGTASVSVEEFRFDAEYDGQGGYDWELWEAGQKVEQGSEIVGCVVPTS